MRAILSVRALIKLENVMYDQVSKTDLNSYKIPQKVAQNDIF